MPIRLYGFLADFVPGVVFVVLLGAFANETTGAQVPELTTVRFFVVVVFGGYVAGRLVRSVSGSLEGFVERVFGSGYDYAEIYEDAKRRTAPHLASSDDGRLEGYARRLAYEESALYARYRALYRYNRNAVTVFAFYGFALVLSSFLTGAQVVYGFSASLVGGVFLLVAVFLLYRTRVLYRRKKKALEDGFYMGLRADV
jgi:hypothetical protein